jgi:SAM-dependent methyltransferase
MARQHREKVRVQGGFVAQRIREAGQAPARILDVGCGPSLDVAQAMTELAGSRAAEIVLVDMDGDALASSEARLAPLAHPNVRLTYEKNDAIRAVRNRIKNDDDRFDGILFGGLFDYLQDRHIELLLKMAKRLLRPSGQILFSQVAPDNPDRTYMEWFGDWKLLLRDEAHVLRLAESAGFARDAIAIEREPSGCAIVCRLR